MNSPIFMISRKILQTSPTAADDSPRRFDPYITAILILMAVGALFCLGCLCFKANCSGAEVDSPSVRRRRLAAVNSLPVIPYGGAARQRIMTDDCPICLTEFWEGEFVKLVPCCGHVFHPRCLDTSLETHVTCPVCRSNEWEVCLDVAPDGSEDRSTAESGDTWRHEGVRGTCSCSNLPNRTVLQRSASF